MSTFILTYREMYLANDILINVLLTTVLLSYD